jgi:hypothetical protein
MHAFTHATARRLGMLSWRIHVHTQMRVFVCIHMHVLMRVNMLTCIHTRVRLHIRMHRLLV